MNNEQLIILDQWMRAQININNHTTHSLIELQCVNIKQQRVINRLSAILIVGGVVMHMHNKVRDFKIKALRDELEELKRTEGE